MKVKFTSCLVVVVLLWLVIIHAEPLPPARFSILIVPGHDLDYPGAQFGEQREADLTLLVAKKLAAWLQADPRFAVTVARDLTTGTYLPELTNFFQTAKTQILAFRDERRARFDQVRLASTTPSLSHNFAPAEVALRLNGLNYWANLHHIDLTLHLHINDDAFRAPWERGEHQGFAIYVPGPAYPNAVVSQAIGSSLLESLRQALPPSNKLEESHGLVSDGELIALGPNASRDGAALLVEYGYIYEPRWQPPVAEITAEAVAERTYLGLLNYLALAKVSGK